MATKATDHLMHLLQSAGSVKDTAVRRQLEQQIVELLQAERETVVFESDAPEVETEDDDG